MTSPYADYEPSAPPGHPQLYPSPSPAGTYGGTGHAAGTGPGPFAHPGYPGGYPAMGPSPYPYPGSYYPVGMIPLPPDSAPMPGVGPVEAVKRFFRRYAQFRGYASPSEFWWAYGFLMLATLAIYMLGGVLTGILTVLASDPQSEQSAAEVGLAIFTIALCVFMLVIFIPYLAVAVRRLHDTGKSGLFLLLAFVPFGSIVILVLLCMPSRPDLYRPEWS
ncbi:DUF805 domain-containing protein [Actinomyces bowdenii]|uniref:DUF805 domain-containing protein n=1 Tax=Actinomyces bowdenii TaxID=131109 RepID=UPI001FB980C8|nr:DUF805 domain-containing protein [Actinomyces bowdenii]